VRSQFLELLRQSEPWDIVVIGGGATGLGTALDAASRGYRTLLLESHDFAKGTSSRSTKLVHGGVRYLAQGNIALVREALHERGLLRRNAPHLVRTLGFVVPSYSWITKPFYGIGLKVYDLLAGKLGLGATRLISKQRALELVETLEPEGLRGGVLYYDGQFDDARLAVAILRTFLDLGGCAVNYVGATGLIKQGGRIAGVSARDEETGETFEISARAVVNATGVFADSVRRMDDPDAATMISPSQGIHLVLDRKFLPGETAIMIPKTDDGRVMFALPWHDRVVVGTTDTPVNAISEEPRPLAEEIESVLKHARRYLSRDPNPDDVLSTFAGLRPLIKVPSSDARKTSVIPRDHKITVSPRGLVTVTGGKWTTYRHMGEETVDCAVRVASLPKSPSETETMRLRGWTEATDDQSLTVYGADAPAVEEIVASSPELSELLHPALPYRAGEVVWAVRHEMARTVEDVLSRRLRALLLDARASAACAPMVARLIARELARDAAWESTQVETFRALAKGYLL
jgi:glycerol-3-phosphate dehydrogenase